MEDVWGVIVEEKEEKEEKDKCVAVDEKKEES